VTAQTQALKRAASQTVQARCCWPASPASAACQLPVGAHAVHTCPFPADSARQTTALAAGLAFLLGLGRALAVAPYAIAPTWHAAGSAQAGVGLPLLLGLGAVHVAALEAAGPADAAAAALLAGAPVARLALLTSQLLPDTHSAVLRALQARAPNQGLRHA